MVRQCAWCLRLIDTQGERVSQRPLPKLYEATHGMCSECGTLWMERASEPVRAQATVREQDDVYSTPFAASQTVTQIVLDLQSGDREKSLIPNRKRRLG